MSTTHEVTVRSRRILEAAAARVEAAAWGCDPQALAAGFPGGDVVALTLAVELLQADAVLCGEATEVARLLVHTLVTEVPLVGRLPALFEQDWTLTPAHACFAFVVLGAGELRVLLPAELAPPARLKKWEACAWPGRIDACFHVFPPPAQAPSLDGGTLLQPHADGQDFALSSAVLAPDGALLATGGEHGTVALWRTADLGEVFRLLDEFQEDSDPSPYLQFSPDGRTLAWTSLDGDGLRMCPIDQVGEIARVRGEFYPYAFCPAGQTLVAQHSGGLALVEAATGAQLRALAPGSGGQDTTSFAVARQGLLAVATRDEVRVLSLPDGAQRWADPLPTSGGSPPELAFDFTGDRLAVSRPGGVITVHDARTGAVHAKIPTASERTGIARTDVMSLDFAPDGQHLAVAVCEVYPKATYSQVWIVRIADGAVLRKLGAPARASYRVQFAPGPLLLVQDYDRLTLHRIPVPPASPPASRGVRRSGRTASP